MTYNPFTANPVKVLHFSGALALRTELQSARMSKIKNGGLDQYGTKAFEQEQFGTVGVEGVKDHGRQQLYIVQSC